jgi:hypothetical protein
VGGDDLVGRIDLAGKPEKSSAASDRQVEMKGGALPTSADSAVGHQPGDLLESRLGRTITEMAHLPAPITLSMARDLHGCSVIVRDESHKNRDK